MPDFTFQELYPTWDPDSFALPGAEVVQEQTCVSAAKAAAEAVSNKGGTCPCCGQHVQVYRRSIYKRMAKCLLWLVAEYQTQGGDWVSLKSGPVFRGGDNAKLSYWRLILRHDEETDLYKPTQIAVDFASRKISLPKYAYVYDGQVQGFSTERVYVDECLEGDFDLSDIGLRPWSEPFTAPAAEEP